jgi:AraC-like DNA-binding protein
MPAIPLGEFIDYIYVDRHTDSLLSLKESTQPTHPIATIHSKSISSGNAQIKGVFTQKLKENKFTSDQFIGIRFKPYGIYTGFGIQGESLANRVVPCDAIFPEINLDKTAEILHSGDDLAAVTFLHDALYDRLQPKPLLYEITNMVDALIEADLSKNSQRHLAEAFERSPKSFIEVFSKAIGITPLHYLHIHKVEAARQLISEMEISLTEIGYVLGFYDQSHFIRVFKAHTGCTPFQFRAQINSKVNSVQF